MLGRSSGAPKSAATPKPEQNFLALCRLPPTSGAPAPGVEGGFRSWGRGRAGPPLKSSGWGQTPGGGGGGGRGRNLTSPGGTQRGHHGECGTDGRRANEHGGAPGGCHGGRAAGWAGPRLAGLETLPPSSRRGCAGEGERKGGFRRPVMGSGRKGISGRSWDR